MKQTKHTLPALASILTAASLAFLGTSCAEDSKDNDHGEHKGEHAGHDDDQGAHAHAEDGDKHDDDHAGHDHGEKVASPNGGRVITAVEPHLEFLVTDDRKVRITALDEHNKPAKIANQSVRLTGGSRTSPTKMSFTKDGDVLVSDIAFPAGNNLPIVLQIKPTFDAKTVIAKFTLNLNDCPTCKYKEYACACAH